jgi:hypothetical protein
LNQGSLYFGKFQRKEIIEHWEQEYPNSITDINISGIRAIGSDDSIRFQIPERGVDLNGNVIWESYGMHNEDFVHRYTAREMAEFSVSFATNWAKYQIDNYQSQKPVKFNDFSMAGNGHSPLNHHEGTYPFDLMIPSKNGQDIRFFDNRPGGILSKPTYDKMGNVNINPNYDREKTIQMIKVIGESLPPGKMAEIRFNDPEVIKYFKDTNIKVMFSGGHDHHIDVRLVDDN